MVGACFKKDHIVYCKKHQIYKLRKEKDDRQNKISVD